MVKLTEIGLEMPKVVKMTKKWSKYFKWLLPRKFRKHEKNFEMKFGFFFHENITIYILNNFDISMSLKMHLTVLTDSRLNNRLGIGKKSNFTKTSDLVNSWFYTRHCGPSVN